MSSKYKRETSGKERSEDEITRASSQDFLEQLSERDPLILDRSFPNTEWPRNDFEGDIENLKYVLLSRKLTVAAIATLTRRISPMPYSMKNLLKSLYAVSNYALHFKVM
jgi:hypothetical protein